MGFCPLAHSVKKWLMNDGVTVAIRQTARRGDTGKLEQVANLM